LFNPQLLYAGTSGNGVFAASISTVATAEAKTRGGKDYYLRVCPSVVNQQTRISFVLPNQTDISLAIYDALGRKVSNLCNQRLGPGQYEFTWQGDLPNGRFVNNGVYFVVLNADTEVLRQKITISQ
jgi:flagellar hook assembly protein FlgD